MLSSVLSSAGSAFNPMFLSDTKGQKGQAASTSRQETDSQAGESYSGNSGDRSVQVALTPEDQRLVDKLVATDRTVRAHERAHLSAGGDLVRGSASFEYQTGPDGKRYAVGGEVSIDTSKGRTPEETIPKAQRIRAAALAPANPSSQDQHVAAMASRMEMQAQQELTAQRNRDGNGTAEVSLSAGFRERAVAAYKELAQSAGLSLSSSSGFSAFA